MALTRRLFAPGTIGFKSTLNGRNEYASRVPAAQGLARSTFVATLSEGKQEVDSV